MEDNKKIVIKKVFILIIFIIIMSGCSASTIKVNSTSILKIADKFNEESSTSILSHQPGPTAKFKTRVNDNLYRYYPLAVGNKWIYESWTYKYVSPSGEIVLIKEISELTVSVDKIYEEEGVEYVELSRVLKIVGLKEINEESEKVIRNLPLPKEEKLIFKTTAVLEISNLSISYLSPAYPDYIDSFPLKEETITDLNITGDERWESVYGHEALVWKRKKVDDYNVNESNKKLRNCFMSYIYDLRGNSGSKDEITFCEGVGPVKYVSELIKHNNFSYYDNLVDYQVDK